MVIVSILYVGRVKPSALTPVSKRLPQSSGVQGSKSVEVDDNFVYVQRYTAKYDTTHLNYWVDVIKKTNLIKVYDVLRPPSPQKGDLFGWSISSNNEYLVVSAPHGSSGKGAVFIYKIVPTSTTENTFVFQKAIYDLIAWAISINEHNILFGTHYSSPRSKTHVYSPSGGWKEIHIIEDTYYNIVSSTSTTLAVVSPRQEDPRIYEINPTATPPTKLIQTVYIWRQSCSYIHDASISNHNLLVGCANDKVLVYTLIDKQWTYTQTLNPTIKPSEGDDYFGLEVRVYNNLLVVSAPWFSFNNKLTKAGIVYLYTRGEGGMWSQSLILQEDQPASDNWFGSRIEVDEEYVYISARNSPTYYFRHISYSAGEETL